jgi:hypothetical protein
MININVVLPDDFYDILKKIKEKYNLRNNAEAICKALELAKQQLEEAPQ